MIKNIINKITFVQIFFIFYISGIIIIITPLIISFVFFQNSFFFQYFYDLLKIKYNAPSILLLLFSTTAVILYDTFIFNDIQQFIINDVFLNKIYQNGKKIHIYLLISIMSGIFEELLFRGYLYFFFSLLTIKLNINQYIIFDILIISIISFIFASLHITQGVIGIISSFIFSIIYFILIKLSGTIWYGIIGHAIFNFIEIYLIYPYQKKKFYK